MGKGIGEILREGRQNQRLSVAECAKRTHISPRYIEALEEERWTDLPSESHRMGFLQLYAKFLGVYSEDLVQAYRQAQMPAPEPTEVTTEAEGAAKPAKPVKAAKPAKPAREQSVGSTTWHRLILWIIFGLIALYGIYHAVRRFQPHQVDLSWLKMRPRASNNAPRLVTPKTETHIQRIRAKADSSAWLRVSDSQQLYFEGVLPAGMTKEWSGAGPFRIKVGDIRTVTLTWNDQPVDLRDGARGNVADLRLPPSTEAERR
jgi:cytoskeletal protein RodZ